MYICMDTLSLGVIISSFPLHSAGGLGRLGLGNTNNYFSPPNDPISLPDDFIPIHMSGGEYFTCALSQDGRIGCWGYNGLFLLFDCPKRNIIFLQVITNLGLVQARGLSVLQQVKWVITSLLLIWEVTLRQPVWHRVEVTVAQCHQNIW